MYIVLVLVKIDVCPWLVFVQRTQLHLLKCDSVYVLKMNSVDLFVCGPYCVQFNSNILLGKSRFAFWLYGGVLLSILTFTSVYIKATAVNFCKSKPLALKPVPFVLWCLFDWFLWSRKICLCRFAETGIHFSVQFSSGCLPHWSIWRKIITQTSFKIVCFYLIS